MSTDKKKKETKREELLRSSRDLRSSSGDVLASLHVPRELTKDTFDPTLYGEIVRKGFRNLWERVEEDGDVEITVGVKDSSISPLKMYAHKLVLCVWSTVFRQKITQQLEKQKGGSNSDKLPLEVEVEERERDLFPLVMRYMYTGETDFVDGKNVLPLLDLSNRLGIEALKEVCGELLGPLVDDETLMYLLELVERYRVHSLEHACGLHLAEHFDELLMDGRAQDLPPSLWAAMLSSDDLKMISEEDIFEAVLNYAKSKFKDKKQRDQVLSELLPCIRFPIMTTQFLAEKVEAEEAIKELPVMKQLIHEAYRHKLFPDAIKGPRTELRAGLRFDPAKCGTGITLSNQSLTATSNTSSWVNVRCSHPFTPERNYVEWKVGTGTNMMLGVVEDDCARTGYAGQYTNGWTYYSPGQIYNSGSSMAYTNNTYNSGDSVEVMWDSAKEQLIFYKNQTSVHTYTLNNRNKSKPLYPIASFSSSGSTVTLVPNAYPPGLERTKTKAKPTTVATLLGGKSSASEDKDKEDAQTENSAFNAFVLKNFLQAN